MEERVGLVGKVIREWCMKVTTMGYCMRIYRWISVSDVQHGQDAFMRSNRIKYLLSNAYFLHPLVAFGEGPLTAHH